MVLETNRVFGGDSGYYYLDIYAIKDGVMNATVKITKHDPTWSNAFGDYAGAFEVEIVGSSLFSVGRNVLRGQPQIKLSGE